MVQRGILLQTFLVIISSLVLTTVESQVVSIYPPSIGAQRGEPNVVISCNITGLGDNKIEWLYYPTGQSTGFTTIFSTYDNLNHDPTNFAVSPLTVFGDTHSIDLVIKAIKPELATQYTCNLSPAYGHGKSSYVIALDPVECPSSNSGTIEYNEGNEANISCSVSYYDKTSMMAPNVTWYRDGQPVPGVVTINEPNNRRTARLTKNVTSADDDQEFVCIVDFVNSNPDYTDNCSTTFYVIHTVSEISFYPPSSAEAPASVPVDGTINCTANGRPPPTIEWYDETGNLLSPWSELLVTEEMRSWAQPITLYCRANNTINNGVSFEGVEGNYTFTVVEADYIVESAGVEPWIIAVAVIVPIVIIAIIAIIVFFVIRNRKKKKAKAKTTNGSAAARPTTTTTTTTSYSAVPNTDYTTVSRPPPTSAPRTTGSITSTGPPGPDNRNGAGGYGQNPGFGDLGVQTYGGSNQAVNAYPPARSLHGSNQALGVAGVSMNPNPGYPVRGNPALNTSVTTNPRPAYPYTGSNSALNASLSLSPNANAAPGGSYGRQPSIASSSGRSHASSYNAAIPAMEMNRYPNNDLSSMHGSEV